MNIFIIFLFFYDKIDQIYFKIILKKIFINSIFKNDLIIIYIKHLIQYIQYTTVTRVQPPVTIILASK